MICVPDPTGNELWWSERVPQAMGVFVIVVALLIAYQRHEFTSPNLGLAILVLITLPWAFDMVGRPRRLVRSETRLQYPFVLLWTAVTLGGVYWLSISFLKRPSTSPRSW